MYQQVQPFLYTPEKGRHVYLTHTQAIDIFDKHTDTDVTLEHS